MKPKIDAATIELLVGRHYQFVVTRCQELPGERDLNFLVTCKATEGRATRFVFKVSHPGEQSEFLHGQIAMLDRLQSANLQLPRIVPTVEGQTVFSIDDHTGPLLCRMVTFVPGTPMSETRYRPASLNRDIGIKLAEMSVLLKDFDHPSFHRDFKWDLANGMDTVRQRFNLINDDEHHGDIVGLLDRFALHTQACLEDLPCCVIHNDANDANIILADLEAGCVGQHAMRGLIDFGDAVYSYRIGDLAVAAAYAVLDQNDPLAVLGDMVRGYNAVVPLTAAEQQALFGLVCLRLGMSAAIAAEQIKNDPDNEYLRVSQSPIRRTMPKLVDLSFSFVEACVRHWCGKSSVDCADSVRTWLQRKQTEFKFPINPQRPGVRPSDEETIVLNLGVDSPLIPTDIDAIREPELTDIIFQDMERRRAVVAVGQYLEPRLLYSSSHFIGENLAEENRTIHLGIDLFAIAGTDVIAPLAGTVYFAGAINKPLDYGGLILLQHATDAGEPFFTLYGHLDPNSYPDLGQGQLVAAGQKIARLGAADCNGGWTPHLHFQLMLDLVDLEHEFPGVALESQKEVWSALSPDPNLILGISKDCFPAAVPDKNQTLRSRKKHVGAGLSVAYEDPCKIVRGWKQYLFDETGRRFLDAYNNVPHVGHCHPHVVQAITNQASLLNTNTRYLHDRINRLAEQLAGTMPDGLDVCYFVNSASEANELALRLARAHTLARDTIVVESAYHGHTTSLIDISPYKHDGPGGSGSPDWVHRVPLPNLFHQRLAGNQRSETELARDFASVVTQVAKQVTGSGRRLACFMFETFPSVAGQIILPDGYLSQACQTIRENEGLCIADEVQTGYGRLGETMYGFQMHQLVPDIVVLGKPMGNGHPLAAVVTRRDIAESFDNGMEFFSTFGGNPVSCSAGLAVLDVLHGEQLIDNAKRTGDYLLTELKQLKTRFPLIGDVRGRGLFLGVELVARESECDQDWKQALAAAAAPARFIVNRCREQGVLLGTDGPLGNVLKIRPPMCFDIKNAAQLIGALERSFEMLSH